MTDLIIRNEEDLFSAMERVINADDDTRWEIKFVEWPRFEITIRGESFDGGVPTRIMPALIDLQRKIDASYSKVVYGEEKRLTSEDKKKTELIVHFKSGTTTFTSDIWKILNNATQQMVGKMTGPEIALTVLGLAAIFGTYVAYKAHLNKKLAEKELDHRVEMSEQETKRLKIFSDALQASKPLQEQNANAEEFHDKLLKKLMPNDELVFKGERVIDGETARIAIRKNRIDPVESRLDGEYLILLVESGGITGGYRIKVRNIATNDELFVNVPDGTMQDDEIDSLKTGEWGKIPLRLSLNTRKINEKIVDATLVEAGLKPSEPPA
jgi:hypothetical protein